MCFICKILWCIQKIVLFLGNQPVQCLQHVNITLKEDRFVEAQKITPMRSINLNTGGRDVVIYFKRWEDGGGGFRLHLYHSAQRSKHIQKIFWEKLSLGG